MEAVSKPHLTAFTTERDRAGEFQISKLGCSGSSTAKSAASDRNIQSRHDNNSSAMTAPKINFPAENSPQRANSAGSFNIRAKVVPLKPGRSLMDWIRLGKSGQDLAGTGGITKTVTVEELSKHNTEHDAWISIRGCLSIILFFFIFVLLFVRFCELSIKFFSQGKVPGRKAAGG